MSGLKNSRDSSLRDRARAVVPGGMWGHMNAAALPEGYPQFFAARRRLPPVGCRWHEYVDFMCSWGPIMLGHHHPEVEEAARQTGAARRRHERPGEVLVELAELVVELLPHADWCIVPEERHRRHHDLRHARARRHRAAQDPGGARALITARCPGARPRSPASPRRIARTSSNTNTTTSPASRTAVEQAGGDLAGIIVTAFRA